MRLALNLPHIQLPPWAYRVYDFLARWVPPVLRWTSLIFLCLFIGLTVAVMGMFGAIFWCGIAAMLLLPLVVTQQNRLLREGTVYVYLGYIVLLPMAVKMTFEGLQSPPQILLFTLGLLGLPAFFALLRSEPAAGAGHVVVLVVHHVCAVVDLLWPFANHGLYQSELQ